MATSSSVRLKLRLKKNFGTLSRTVASREMQHWQWLGKNLCTPIAQARLESLHDAAKTSHACLIVDVSQGPDQQSAAPGCVPCLLTHSLPYSFSPGIRRHMVPLEQFLVQGMHVMPGLGEFKAPWAAGLVDSRMTRPMKHTLAGNIMHGEVVTTLLCHALGCVKKNPKRIRASLRFMVGPEDVADAGIEFEDEATELMDEVIELNDSQDAASEHVASDANTLDLCGPCGSAEE